MSTGLIIQGMRKGNVSPGTILNNYEFTRRELDRVKEEILGKKSVAKRKKIPGLDEKRADIIPAGIIILSTILDLNAMTISGYALREGIIIDTLQKLHADSSRPNLSDIRNESVKHLAESCKYDKAHCGHIAKLTMEAFRQLENLHELGEAEGEYLHAAAILHDIGYHISHSNHHHHSYYIIKNSELLGFNENEINIIAHVARYHRKSHPKSRHEDFNSLPSKTQNIIKKLAAILRITDALDRTHKQLVKSLKIKITQYGVELILHCEKGIKPEIELWNIERRKALFEEVYGKNVTVKIS
jgi:exopolyphosphatase/guanosine-5'-triphosphate,3'-diphosphate pyrophosphatase